MSGLPDWRSAVGHAFADAVHDQIWGYDRSELLRRHPLVIVRAVLQDLGFRKTHRVPDLLLLALVAWVRGMQEEEERRGLPVSGSGG